MVGPFLGMKEHRPAPDSAQSVGRVIHRVIIYRLNCLACEALPGWISVGRPTAQDECQGEPSAPGGEGESTLSAPYSSLSAPTGTR